MSPIILIIIGVVAIIAIGLALYKWGVINPEAYLPLLDLLNCCSSLGIFGVTLVVTLGTFLLWHSLLVAALAGGSIMTMMLIVLSVAAASYKAGSQSS